MEEYEDDEATLTIECGTCGADVYEDAVVCPACNEYVSHGGSAFRGRPLWFWLLGGAGVLALLWVLVT